MPATTAGNRSLKPVIEPSLDERDTLKFALSYRFPRSKAPVNFV